MNKFRLIFHYNSKVMFKKRLVVPKAYPCLQTQTVYIKDKNWFINVYCKTDWATKQTNNQIYGLSIPSIEQSVNHPLTVFCQSFSLNLWAFLMSFYCLFFVRKNFVSVLRFFFLCLDNFPWFDIRNNRKSGVQFKTSNFLFPFKTVHSDVFSFVHSYFF